MSARDAGAEALREQARRALAQGGFEEAEKCLRELLKVRPGDLEARGGLGRALLQQGKLDDCEAQAAEIIKRFPKSAQAIHAAARLYDQIHNNEAAIEQARRAAEMAADPAPILADLASVFERVHRLAEAREAVTRALELQPDLPAAHLTDGLLHAREKDYERAEQRFQFLVEAAGASVELRVRAGYELGRTLDRLGRYDEAMEALKRAKTLQKPGCLVAVQQARVLNRQNEAMGKAITANDFRGVEAEELTAVGLMVGFPRTGSTLLESALDRHPGMITAEETPALAAAIVRPLAKMGPQGRSPIDLVRQMTPQQAHVCRAQYLTSLETYMRAKIGDRFVLDKNPAYTHAVPFLKRLFPRAKTITMLRDPRDICISCFMMHAASTTPFNVAFLDWEETARHFTRTLRIWLQYRAVLGEDYIEVRYEDMVADLESQVRRVLDYLELPWRDEVMSYRERAKDRPAMSPTYADVTQPVYTRAVQRWRHYEKYIEPILPTLEPVMGELGYGV